MPPISSSSASRAVAARPPAVSAARLPVAAAKVPKAWTAPRAAGDKVVANLAADVPGGLMGPDWVKDAIFYQVFPDRFRDGDSSNNPKGTAPWGSPPQNDRFFEGGDLQGVSQGLGHLKKLGVNALYLNPIFTSPSSHRYDTADYLHVDPVLGGDAAFTSLVDKVHAGGIKLILDGVLNHTSNEHVWFNDVKEKGQASKYWSWYKVNKFPITTFTDDKGVLRSNDYEGWGKPEWGGPYATLPVLQHTNPEVLEALFTGKDSVVRHWLREGKIDGWRMDAADEVEPAVWRDTRKAIKQENPEAYMLGENWHDSSGMLKGDQFDGATNYNYFQQPAVDFFARKSINADQFAARLKNGYSTEAKLGMLNILESHDTPRFITQAGGDWYRARPAAIFQMTYQGAPSIYYGAEVGMEGGPDPDSRRAFDWKTADRVDAQKGPQGGDDRASNLFDMYQKLIVARKGSDALRRGDFDVLATHNDQSTIAYRRSIAGDAHDAVVALNNDSSSHTVDVPVGSFAPDGTAFLDALSGAKLTVQGGKLSVKDLQGNYGAVLLRES